MSTINDGGPAFPICVPVDFQFANNGMTLRDYFAGQALANIADHFSVSGDRAVTKASQLVVARLCYDYADAMLAAREAKP